MDVVLRVDELRGPLLRCQVWLRCGPLLVSPLPLFQGGKVLTVIREVFSGAGNLPGQQFRTFPLTAAIPGKPFVPVADTPGC